MSASLIINARHRLAWHQRFFSDASTVLMWAIWLKLWVPVVRSFPWFAQVGAFSRATLLHVLPTGGHALGMPRYAVALVGTSGTLLLWNRLPAFKARVPEVNSVGDYARQSELSEAELLAGRDSPVCVVHHDDFGRIVRVEQRAA